jgi:hypothetical protein
VPDDIGDRDVCRDLEVEVVKFLRSDILWTADGGEDVLKVPQGVF